jgi:hypothetical protein
MNMAPLNLRIISLFSPSSFTSFHERESISFPFLSGFVDGQERLPLPCDFRYAVSAGHRAMEKGSQEVVALGSLKTSPKRGIKNELPFTASCLRRQGPSRGRMAPVGVAS